MVHNKRQSRHQQEFATHRCEIVTKTVRFFLSSLKTTPATFYECLLE